MNGTCWLSRLLLCTLAVSVASVRDAMITLALPEGTGQLRSAIADWGYQFNRTGSHSSNLMLPPEEDGPFLCTYPSSLNDTYFPPGSLSRPIALLVRRGDCTFEQKAQVALALQQNYSGVIKYVIIYNNDTVNYSELIGLESKTDFPSLGFLSISTRAGSYVTSFIVAFAESTNTNPYLSTSINDLKDWDYLIEVVRWDTMPPGSGSFDTDQNAFYWVRFVLFTLLILSPCLRAAYLWWRAGGRFVFARNERGRIVGLRVVRPAPYWLVTHGGAPVQPASRWLLTEEQVKALPEIAFVPPPRSADDHDDDDDDDDDRQASIHGQATINLDNDEEQGQAIKQDTEPEIHLPPQTDSEPEIHIPPSTDQEEEEGVVLSTSSTTCSICIDDFEAGEKVRLLPKCRHAFHTDCIMPWLTERQGCCPLCKVHVLDGNEEESGAVASDTALASDTAVASNTTVASDTAVASEAPNVHTQRRSDDSPA